MAATAARKLERAVLLEALRCKGITVLEARYDGCSDSGNVGEIDCSPEDAEIGDIETRLADFIWGLAYGLHPGFEINDGGEGTFIWDIKSDRIDIDHGAPGNWCECSRVQALAGRRRLTTTFTASRALVVVRRQVKRR